MSGFLLSLSLIPGIVEAAESGSVRGSVNDETELGIPGANIVLSGSGIAGEMIVQSDEDGNFRFINVPVGKHDLKVLKTGFSVVQRKVTVRLDEAAFVPVTLVYGQEVFIIEETLPVLDTTRSAISTQLSKEMLDKLPTGRSYQDAVNIIPGVYGRVDTSSGGSGDGNPSVRGEGQYGNNYLVDGVSTRDPATKTAGSDVNFDAIEDIQVYTDGAPAEFGQMTGMLVNVVTKDGGDEHHGSAAYFLNTDASVDKTHLLLDTEAGEEVETDKPTYLTHNLSLTAGGPVAKEKLWYFASLDLFHDRTVGPGTTEEDPYLALSGGGFAKLTWFVSQDVTLRYQFNGQTTRIENATLDALYSPEVQDLYTSDELGHQLQAVWRPALKTEMNLKVLTSQSHLADVPMSGDHDTPQIIDAETRAVTGNWDSFDLNVRDRTGFTFSVTQLADNALGSHKIKFGTEAWSLSETRDLDFTGPDEGLLAYDSDTDTCSPDDNYVNCEQTTYYWGSDPLSHNAVTLSAYLQDDWQPIETLTINAGARVDHEELYTSEGIKIVDQFMPAPRLGVAWDITGDSKTKFTVNAGQYYDVNGASFAEWGDSRTAYGFDQYYQGEYYYSQGAYPLVFCTDASLDTLSGKPKRAAEEICDGELRPYHMDKLVVGFDREIFPLLAVGIRGVLSQTVDIPEDINYDDYNWVITNPDNKRRDYRAVELVVEKKLDDHWMLLGGYTISESMGTMPGQFESASGGDWGGDGNGVGVWADDISDADTRAAYFDAGYGSYVQGYAGLGSASNEAGYYGYLPYDSTHQVKLNGAYTLTMKRWETTIGAVYEFDSGHAWEKKGYVVNYGDYLAFPEGRGTRRMPPVHYFDMSIAESFEIDEYRSAELSVDIFNVLDLEQPITYYANEGDMFGLVYYRQAPRSVVASLKVTY